MKTLGLHINSVRTGAVPVKGLLPSWPATSIVEREIDARGKKTAMRMGRLASSDDKARKMANRKVYAFVSWVGDPRKTRQSEPDDPDLIVGSPWRKR